MSPGPRPPQWVLQSTCPPVGFQASCPLCPTCRWATRPSSTRGGTLDFQTHQASTQARTRPSWRVRTPGSSSSGPLRCARWAGRTLAPPTLTWAQKWPRRPGRPDQWTPVCRDHMDPGAGPVWVSRTGSNWISSLNLYWSQISRWKGEIRFSDLIKVCWRVSSFSRPMNELFIT